MGFLRIYKPETRTRKLRLDEAEPATISFAAHARHLARGQRMLSALNRARSLHANRTCPHCQHPVVEPLELDDAAVGASNLPIPGTATLVGFHCHGCQQEWPA